MRQSASARWPSAAGSGNPRQPRRGHRRIRRALAGALGQGSLSRSGLSRQARGRRSTSARLRSEEHTSELQSLMRISYAVFCLKKKKNTINSIVKNYAQTTAIHNTLLIKVHTQ